MADNMTLPATGGIVRTIDKGSTIETQVVALDAGGSGAESLVSSSNPLPVNAAGVSVTGTLGALNAAVELTLNGANGFAADLRGTSSQTTQFQGTVDGTNWFTIAVVPAGGAINVGSITSTTAAGVWMGNANGYLKVRATTTVYTSGSFTAVLRAIASPSMTHAYLTGGSPSVALAAGSQIAGDFGVTYRTNATGAASGYHIVSAASTNTANIKASAGRVLAWSLANTTASWRYVKLHNTAGTPTAGASVARAIAIPPGGVSNLDMDGGIAFSTGIGISIVTGSSDADATAVGAGDVIGEIFFA